MPTIHCVIGSGPSGVACARALLGRGVSVHLIDAGQELDAERARAVAVMAGMDPQAWRPEQLAQLREGVDATSSGIPLKRAYGSDFPYRDAQYGIAWDDTRVGLRPSFARGGLSNVWGAAMLPYRVEDLAGWPAAAQPRPEHYRPVVEMTGLAGTHDDLAGDFPLFSAAPDTLVPSAQARAFLDRLARHRDELHAAGIAFGQSRLAVRGNGSARNGCCYCAQCLYGCPFGFIYNSMTTLRELGATGRLTYTPNVVVDAVSESADEVRVTGHDRVTRNPIRFTCGRVFLAAGTIHSTRLWLQALGAFDVPVHVKDSQYFVVPLLTLRGTPRVSTERLHTLSQAFLELSDPSLSPYTVHLQVYTYNDLLGRAVRSAFGPLAAVLAPLARQLEGRLFVIQGYLHSVHSPTIELTLRAAGPAQPSRLEMRDVPNPATRPLVRRVLRKLLRHARLLGAAPLTPLLRMGRPGQGFHSGGSLPMRDHPGHLESDVWGRPAGLSRIHVADSSVFPTIPATTITLAAMANAYRIGSESPL